MTDDRSFLPLSDEKFAMLGAPAMAYYHRVDTEQGIAYAIYAANGVEVGVVETEADAIVAIRNHDLEPVRVH